VRLANPLTKERVQKERVHAGSCFRPIAVLAVVRFRHVLILPGPKSAAPTPHRIGSYFGDRKGWRPGGIHLGGPSAAVKLTCVECGRQADVEGVRGWRMYLTHEENGSIATATYCRDCAQRKFDGENEPPNEQPQRA
jgi:hypothetical protein